MYIKYIKQNMYTYEEGGVQIGEKREEVFLFILRILNFSYRITFTRWASYFIVSVKWIIASEYEQPGGGFFT